MITVFRYSFARFRVEIIGWGIAVFLWGLIIVPFYDIYFDNKTQFTELLNAYPPEVMAFLGDISIINTPEGWLSLEYFTYMPLILGIFAVLAGSGLITGDEENGTLDLVLAHPISRFVFFVCRVMALYAVIVLLLVIAWFGLLIPSFSSSLNLSAIKLTLPFLSLFAELVLFGNLSLLFSLMFPSRRIAAMVAGFVLATSFFFEGLSQLTDKLEQVVIFSPLHYYQSGKAINGLNVIWFLGLLIFSFFFILVSWVLFKRRDIRVSGEGNWSLPALYFWRKTE